MKQIVIKNSQGIEILKQFNSYLNGSIKDKNGEYILEFDNHIGKGIIRTIAFDWGVSWLDYNVKFKNPVKVNFNVPDFDAITFIFLTKGFLTYTTKVFYKAIKIARYQNSIISSEKNASENYMFPENIAINASFIYVIPNEYSKKKSSSPLFLDKKLFPSYGSEYLDYSSIHVGNYDIKIADQLHYLYNGYCIDILRTQYIEGQLNLIITMQLLAFQAYQNNIPRSGSLSQNDMDKIDLVAQHITYHILDQKPIKNLLFEIGLSRDTLSIGFKILYDTSPSEYTKQLKLKIAKDWIKNTDHSISEIAYKIGFKSRGYFSKIFFEKYGLLPMSYRKNTRTKK